MDVYKTLMNLVLLLMVAANLSFTKVETWIVSLKDGQPVLNSKDAPTLTIPLVSSGGMPRVLSVEPATSDPNILVIKYDSGTAGTRSFYRINRAVILNVSTLKVVGDVLESVKALGQSPKLPQPQWTWSKNSLTVDEGDSGREVQIKW